MKESTKGMREALRSAASRGETGNVFTGPEVLAVIDELEKSEDALERAVSLIADRTARIVELETTNRQLGNLISLALVELNGGDAEDAKAILEGPLDGGATASVSVASVEPDYLRGWQDARRACVDACENEARTMAVNPGQQFVGAVRCLEKCRALTVPTGSTDR